MPKQSLFPYSVVDVGLYCVSPNNAGGTTSIVSSLVSITSTFILTLALSEDVDVSFSFFCCACCFSLYSFLSCSGLVKGISLAFSSFVVSFLLSVFALLVSCESFFSEEDVWFSSCFTCSLEVSSLLLSEETPLSAVLLFKVSFIASLIDFSSSSGGSSSATAVAFTSAISLASSSLGASASGLTVS